MRLLSLLCLFVLASCGVVRNECEGKLLGNSCEHLFGYKPNNDEGCYVTEVDDGSIITCNGKSTYVKNGKDGQDGAKGVDGRDGDNGNDGLDGARGVDGVDGVDGKDGVDGVNGSNGEKGDKGDKGDTGEKGDKGDSGRDGVDGVDGVDGNNAPINPYDIVDIIDPCGDHPNAEDEIVLKLYNGSYVVFMEQSGKRFLSLLSPGSYKTTDAQKCNFTITSSGDLIY